MIQTMNWKDIHIQSKQAARNSQHLPKWNLQSVHKANLHFVIVMKQIQQFETDAAIYSIS
jgi:hypothetical protein